MKQLNCKNCGAPIEHNYTHRCKYCDSLIMFDDEEEEFEEVSPNDDLVESWEQLSERIKRTKWEALNKMERIENADKEFKRAILTVFFIFFPLTLFVALVYLVP